jgi:hypothetical protein
MSGRLNTKVALVIMAGLLAACGAQRPMNMPAPLSPTGPVMPAASAPKAPAATSGTTKKPTATPSSKATTGKTATPAKTTTPAKGAAAKPTTAPKTGASANTKSAEDQINDLRAGVAALSEQTRNFQARVQSWNVAANGDKQAVTVKYTFAKPNQTTMEILKSTQESATGAKVLWTGGPKAKIRASVLGLPVKLDLDITDKNLANKRGYTFADTSIERWEQNILDPNSKITIRGKQRMPNGSEAIVFDVVAPNMMPGVTRETYGVDIETKAPLLCQHYEGTKCVYEVQVLEVNFNLNFGPETFTL